MVAYDLSGAGHGSSHKASGWVFIANNGLEHIPVDEQHGYNYFVDYEAAAVAHTNASRDRSDFLGLVKSINLQQFVAKL